MELKIKCTNDMKLKRYGFLWKKITHTKHLGLTLNKEYMAHDLKLIKNQPHYLINDDSGKLQWVVATKFLES